MRQDWKATGPNGFARAALFAALALLIAACDAPREAPAVAVAAGTGADRPNILILGTSLTAGLGVDPDQAYPAVLQRKIDSAGLQFTVVNAGSSGETSAGARSRAAWLLKEVPAVLLLETGANDGLRGLEVDSLRANIQFIVNLARAKVPPPSIVLAGMEAPPNYGRHYTERFHAVYPELARANKLALVPFLLEGVAGIDSLNQADGIHPNAAGHRRVAENIWRALEPLLHR